MHRHTVQVLFVVLSCLVAAHAIAQVAPPTITASFNPDTVQLGSSHPTIFTITVTNPNASALTNVAFSNTVPAGLTLVTQTGGTCGTLATGGGTTTINLGAGVFSATSNSLAAAASCNVTLQMYATITGPITDTTSAVSSNEASPGDPASATLNAGMPVKLQEFEVE